MLRIPRAPDALALTIDRLWDGTACSDPKRHGWLRVAWADDGLHLEAGLPHQVRPRVPDAPAGERVADLWRFDVVECFVVGQGGRYLEVEFGAGGHYLILGFAGPRDLVETHTSFRPSLTFESTADGWHSIVTLPWEVLPTSLCALNAFVIAGDAHLAFNPVPGETPDFHQPSGFPLLQLAGFNRETPVKR